MTALNALTFAITEPDRYLNGEIWVRCGTKNPTPETLALLTLSPMPEGDLTSAWHLLCPAALAIEGIGWF